MSKVWTSKEKLLLLQYYAATPVAILAAKLRKTEQAVRSMAVKMGLERLENLSSRRPMCECGTCPRCKQRVYSRRWVKKKRDEERSVGR